MIGSGNTATVLARLIKKSNHNLLQVISRNIEHARLLAQEMDCSFTDDISDINKQASIFIVAVSDTAIDDIAKKIQLDEKLIVHTCGAVHKDVLKNSSKHYGVLYPLQSLRKENPHIPPVPFLIDGNNGLARKEISQFARTLSPLVSEANDEERMKLHVSAVVVSNFTNHLYALTKEFCDAEGVDFSLLLPLIHEVSLRLTHYPPAEMQTGPASRGDIQTIEAHKELLEKYPQLQNIYQMMSESIMQFIK